MKHTVLVGVVVRWLPLALVISFAGLLSYVCVQQAYRMGANDPQIAMAEDAARQLSAGADARAVIPPMKADIAASLFPYLIIFDANGVPVASSATLDGKIPLPPSGVFDTGTWRNFIAGYRLTWMVSPNENRFTWQPAAGVRQAAVLVQYRSASGFGYVLAGRNLRETEAREAGLELVVFGSMLLAYVVSFFLQYAGELYLARKLPKH